MDVLKRTEAIGNEFDIFCGKQYACFSGKSNVAFNKNWQIEKNEDTLLYNTCENINWILWMIMYTSFILPKPIQANWDPRLL